MPETTEVGAKATLKKKVSGTTFSLSLTDATLKDQGKTFKDLTVTAERKLAGAGRKGLRQAGRAPEVHAMQGFSLAAQ